MAVYGDELYHIGKPMRSGRYPYGSGKEPYQSDPRKRRLYKDESAPKATSKRPESIWAKHRRAQAEKKATKDREARKTKVEKKTKEKAKLEASKPPIQKVKEMSDEELKRAIDRLRNEQTYMSMIAPEKKSPQVSKGKQFIEKLKSSTKDASELATNINSLTKGVMGTYANIRAIQKMLDGQDVKLQDDKEKKKK